MWVLKRYNINYSWDFWVGLLRFVSVGSTGKGGRHPNWIRARGKGTTGANKIHSQHFALPFCKSSIKQIVSFIPFKISIFIVEVLDLLNAWIDLTFYSFHAICYSLSPRHIKSTICHQCSSSLPSHWRDFNLCSYPHLSPRYISLHFRWYWCPIWDKLEIFLYDWMDGTILTICIRQSVGLF